jgi:hypothetical protein
VEVVAGQQDGADWEGDRKRTRGATEVHAPKEQQERYDLIDWVVNDLSEELFTELLQGFHAPPRVG